MSLTKLISKLAVVTVILMMLSSLYMPIHRDEAVFFTIGKRMALGSMPYRDIFDHKMPGIYFISTMVFVIFGAELMPFRILMLLVNLVSGKLLYELMKWAGSSEELARAGVWAFWATNIWYQGNFFITESFVNLLILASIWVVALRSKSGFAGMLLGLALMFKQTAILSILVMFYFVGKRSRRDLVRMVVGITTVIVVFVMWILMNGIFVDMWEATVIYNLRSYPPFPLLYTIKETAKLLAPAIFWWCVGGLGLIALKSRSKEMSMYLWLVMMMVPLVLTRPYHHYWLQLLPFIIIGAVMFLKELKLNNAISFATVIGLSLYYVFFVWVEVRHDLEEQFNKINRSDCRQVEETASYFFADCTPGKYFYEPGRYEL